MPSPLKSKLANAGEAAETARLVRQHEAATARLQLQLKIEQAKREQAEAELLEAVSRQQFLDSLGEPAVSEWPPRKHRVHGAATAIVCVNDWHAEERVDPKTINGLNEYNLTIAAERIKRCFAKACELIDAERGMSHIADGVLWVGGDMLTGYIHEELLENNYLSPTEACLFVQDHLASGIDYLRKHAGCKAWTVVCNHGNHGRTTPKKRVSTSAKNSYEWLLYHQLARTYRDTPGLHWQIADGAFSWLDVQGKRVRFHHGDSFRYQGGIGGVTVPILRGIAQLNAAKVADLDVFGHFHQALFHRRFVLSNCLIGFNAYAAEVVRAEFSPPSQTLIVMDRTKPHPVVVKEIFVG